MQQQQQQKERHAHRHCQNVKHLIDFNFHLNLCPKNVCRINLHLFYHSFLFWCVFFHVKKLFWLMVWFGNTAVYLYIGRVFAGATGGGMYICLPLFVAEIADQRLVERTTFPL